MNRLSLFYKISRGETSVNVPEMRLHTDHRTRTSHAYKYYSIRATNLRFIINGGGGGGQNKRGSFKDFEKLINEGVKISGGGGG